MSGVEAWGEKSGVEMSYNPVLQHINLQLSQV